jgi:hypothetical protein
LVINCFNSLTIIAIVIPLAINRNNGIIFKAKVTESQQWQVISAYLAELFKNLIASSFFLGRFPTVPFKIVLQ